LAWTCRRRLPEAPDLVLENYGALDVATAVDRILAVCARRDAAGAAQPTCFVAFTTKAETLEALAPLLRNGRVLAADSILCCRLALRRRWRARHHRR
jgi:hypothetical protein